MNIPYTVYDYLTFILPGGTILFVVTYGWFGWPWHEPGAAALLGIVAAAFVVGNAVAGVGTWLEPLLVGGRVGKRPSGLWGQFGKNDRYAGREADIRRVLQTRYGSSLGVETAYRLAQTELRDLGKADPLDRVNSQLGFYRGMTVAALISFAVEVSFGIGWHTRLLPGLWLPIFAGGIILFGYRFRRFWRWYGDYVIRGVINLERSSPAKGTVTDA